MAQRHEAMLSASYNRAVIDVQLGETDRALSLQRRHFTVYEKFDAAREGDAGGAG